MARVKKVKDKISKEMWTNQVIKPPGGWPGGSRNGVKG
jgi:hypothetical protein